MTNINHNLLNTQPQYADILRLYLSFGLDETIQETPFNFYNTPKSSKIIAFPASEKHKSHPQLSESSKTYTPIPTSDDYETAQTIENIGTILQEKGKSTKICKSARHFILTHGQTQNPDILIIFDHPSAEEEMTGDIGVSADYIFINTILKSCNLGSKTIGYYNICPWRPAGERSLTSDETALCTAPITKAIQLISPKTVISFSSIFISNPISVMSPNSDKTPIFICPTVLNLRKTPLLKQKIWSKIIELKQILTGNTVA